MACAGISIRYPLQYLPSRHIHFAAYFFYIPDVSLSHVRFHEFTNRLGLSLKLSAHNPILHLLKLHSNIYHSQYLIFCVQKRTIKSSNVEMSKMKSRNFAKFRIFFYFYRVKRFDIRTQQVLKFGYLA